MDGFMDGWTIAWNDSLVGRTEGWMDDGMNGIMDGWME